MDLWAIHGLYLIVIANPRFKASLQLTEPRTPLLRVVLPLLRNPHCQDIAGYRYIHTTIYVYIDVMYICIRVCIYYVEDRIWQNWDQMKDRNTWSLALKDLLTTSTSGGKGCPHTPFPNSIHLYSRPRVSWLVIFAGLPLILKGEEITTYHWQLHGNCYKFYA